MLFKQDSTGIKKFEDGYSPPDKAYYWVKTYGKNEKVVYENKEFPDLFMVAILTNDNEAVKRFLADISSKAFEGKYYNDIGFRRADLYPIDVAISMQDNEEVLDLIRQDFLTRVKDGDVKAIIYLLSDKARRERLFDENEMKNLEKALKDLKNDISKNINKEQVNERNKYGFAPIHIAAAMDDEEFIKQIIAVPEADVNIKSCNISGNISYAYYQSYFQEKLTALDISKELPKDEKNESKVKKLLEKVTLNIKKNWSEGLTTANIVSFDLGAVIAGALAVTIILTAAPVVAGGALAGVIIGAVGILFGGLILGAAAGVGYKYFTYKKENEADQMLKSGELEKIREEMKEPVVSKEAEAARTSDDPSPVVFDPNAVAGKEGKGKGK